MTLRFTKVESQLVEKAITFFVTQYNRSGFNPQPVIFHSLRVACRLAEAGASAPVIAAAVLHDVLEDTRVTKKQIGQHFGSPIAGLVSAVTFNSKIKDKTKRYQDMLIRTKKYSTEAMQIKCADILDNSAYYSFGADQTAEELLLAKLRYFIKLAGPRLKKYPLFIELKSAHRRLVAQLKQAWSETTN